MTDDAEVTEGAATDVAHPDSADERAQVEATQVIPKYVKPHEVRAAREMLGARYDGMVENGVIEAPSRDELSDAALAAKLADDDAERTAHSEQRIERHAAKAETAAKTPAKKSGAKTAAKTVAKKSAKNR